VPGPLPRGLRRIGNQLAPRCVLSDVYLVESLMPHNDGVALYDRIGLVLPRSLSLAELLQSLYCDLCGPRA
jgi:hypothetical protein